MHALTDTGDPESDLPISQKAVQSIGLRGKRAEKFSLPFGIWAIFRDKGAITSQAANSNKE